MDELNSTIQQPTEYNDDGLDGAYPPASRYVYRKTGGR